MLIQKVAGNASESRFKPAVWTLVMQAVAVPPWLLSEGQLQVDLLSPHEFFVLFSLMPLSEPLLHSSREK